jgi:cobalt transporter subunit CbtA
MTKTLLSGGVIAGAIAGLVAAVFQFFLIQPLIVEAERYETGELVLIGIESNKPDPAPNPLETPGHDAQGAENTDNLLVRNGLTVLTLILTWAGFGLLAGAGLTAFRALPGGGRIPATALGLIGFAVLSLAPAIDLPPELPGMEAAELADRQLWWVATVAMTAAGIFFAAGLRSWPGRLAGLALILAPHLFGAPLPPVSATAVPPDLAALYAARVLSVNLIGWLVLAIALLRLLPEAGAKADADGLTEPG